MMVVDPDRFGSVPVNGMLGMELIHRGGGTAKVRLPARSEFAQDGGLLQGGILTAVADAAAVHACADTLADGKTAVSVEFKMNFIRAAIPTSDPVVARARVIKSGRRIVICESTLNQGGRDVAVGLFTYLVQDHS